MTPSKVPSATYRVQFHHGFRFITAKALAPYFAALGISDLYASPLFAARRRSPHGYSVTNPLVINPELGSRESFNALVRGLKSQGLGLILDIVPNHMALSHDNPWWLDVLENGPCSPYAIFFDVDWRQDNKLLHGRVLLPILGAPYGQVLENQELRLNLEESGFFVHYYDHKFPLDPKTWLSLLTHRLDTLLTTTGPEDPGVVRLLEIIALIDRLPPRTVVAARKVKERLRQKEFLKKALWRLYQDYPLIKDFLDQNLMIFNGRPGEPESFDLLDNLLQAQPYRLACWLVARDVINYRRFFSINDLIGLRVEDPLVFEASHGLLFSLAREGRISGVRVDHVDGLFDPTGYLQRLQTRLTQESGGNEQGAAFYIVVEKILGKGETLPLNWPVAGSTGYDFLNILNGVFVQEPGLEKLCQIYQEFIGAEVNFAEVVQDKKRLVMSSLFGGELENLVRELSLLAEQDRQARDISPRDLSLALAEVIVCLPVYRTYIRSFEISKQDRTQLEKIIAEVRARLPARAAAALEFLQRVVLLEFPPNLHHSQKSQWLRFVMRWQQFTGPIMAKGLEDTALYVYHPLTSLNEVGTFYQAVSSEAFHQFNRRRLASTPYSMNATSTHDTKRGEDVRLRLHVLSELPHLWAEKLLKWSAWNQMKKRDVNGMRVPEANQEYFLYQTLLGAWPLNLTEIPDFKNRLRHYLVKSAREAKVHTRWIAPHPEYEQALIAFADAILDDSGDNPFLEDFLPFQRRLAYLGALSSLSQVLLKNVSPGVPDYYQGTELWDLNLVDPDNRRAVDFRHRVEILKDLKIKESQGLPLLVKHLLAHWETGAIKLFVTYKTLNFRKEYLSLFLAGDYLPLTPRGEKREHVIALARRHGQEWVVAAAGRFFASLAAEDNLPLGREVWGEDLLPLPLDAPRTWRNIFTNETLTVCSVSESPSLFLAQVFKHLPVALLHGVVSP